MRRGGALRGAFAAYLGLITLYAVGTKGGSGRVAELFTVAANLIDRALDPTVPAIPDLRNGGSWGSGGSSAASATTGPAGGAYGSADAADHWIVQSPGYQQPGRVGGTV